MFKNLVKKVTGDPYGRLLNGYRARAERINAFEPELKKLTDDGLRARTEALKQKLAGGGKLDDVLEEAFTGCFSGRCGRRWCCQDDRRRRQPRAG